MPQCRNHIQKILNSQFYHQIILLKVLIGLPNCHLLACFKKPLQDNVESLNRGSNPFSLFVLPSVETFGKLHWRTWYPQQMLALNTDLFSSKNYSAWEISATTNQKDILRIISTRLFRLKKFHGTCLKEEKRKNIKPRKINWVLLNQFPFLIIVNNPYFTYNVERWYILLKMYYSQFRVINPIIPCWDFLSLKSLIKKISEIQFCFPKCVVVEA